MSNARMALAVVGGYLCGRYHKARWALTLAGAAAGKRLAGRTGVPGVGRILKSPELDRLAKDVRGDLMAAGRRAFVTAAGSRMDSLSDRLEKRASALRAPTGGKPEEAEEPEEPEQRRKRRPERRESKAPEESRASRASKDEDSDRREGRRRPGGTSRPKGGTVQASKKAGPSRPKKTSGDDETRRRSRG